MPTHLWLPKAHVEAPTAGSVLLAGILLKLGSYGFIRFLLFLFPAASFYFLPFILAIVIISIILPSFTVLRQNDLKRIIAYSSVAHMNFLVGAIFVQNLIALTGSLLLQIAHGLSSSALFLTIGMLYDRYKSRNIFYYAGLVTIMPLFSFFFFVFSLANLGFPSTINFVSEMLIFIGMFQMSPSVTILTLTGIFLSAAYSFVLLTRLLFGPASRQIHKFYDLTRREFYLLLPLAFLIFFLGLFPNYLISFWSFNITTWFSELSFLLAGLPMVITQRTKLQVFLRKLLAVYFTWVLFIRSIFMTKKGYYFIVFSMPIVSGFYGLLGLFYPDLYNPYFVAYVLINSGITLILFDKMGSFITQNLFENPEPILSLTTLISIRRSPNLIKRHYGDKIVKALVYGKTIVDAGGRGLIIGGVCTGLLAGGVALTNSTLDRWAADARSAEDRKATQQRWEADSKRTQQRWEADAASAAQRAEQENKRILKEKEFKYKYKMYEKQLEAYKQTPFYLRGKAPVPPNLE